MSRQIPKEHLENPELLTPAERWYIWTRTPGKYPASLPRPEAPTQEPPPPIPSKVTPLEQQSVPTIGEPGGIVEEEEEDYEEGWNNNQRRAELTRRNLSIEGNKDALIARLRRSDANTLEAGDESPV